MPMLWSSSSADPKNHELEDNLTNLSVKICDSLSFIPTIITFLYVTIAGNGICSRIEDWRQLSDLSLSGHYYIYFDIQLLPCRKKCTILRLHELCKPGRQITSLKPLILATLVKKDFHNW